MISKAKYVSLTQLELGVYDAVANFNIGKKASVLIYERLNLIPGKFIMQGCDKINSKRLLASKYKEVYSTKKAKEKYAVVKQSKKTTKMTTKKDRLIRLAPFKFLHNAILCF